MSYARGALQGVMSGLELVDRKKQRDMQQQGLERQEERFDYRKQRDALQDERYEDTLDYQRGRQKKQDARQAAADKRAEESHRLTTEATRMKLDEARATKRQREALPTIALMEQKFSQAKQTGDFSILTDQDLEVYDKSLDAFGMDLDMFVGDRFGEAANTFAQAAEQGKFEDPAVLEAANVIYRPEINKGTGKLEQPLRLPGGETLPAGTIITEKRIADVYPAGDGENVYLELEMDYKMPADREGKKFKEGTYRAPATEGRDASPGAAVLKVPVGQAMERAQGKFAIRQALEQNPDIGARIAEYVNRVRPGTANPDKWKKLSNNTLYRTGARGQLETRSIPGLGMTLDSNSRQILGAVNGIIDDQFEPQIDQLKRFGDPAEIESLNEGRLKAKRLAEQMLFEARNQGKGIRPAAIAAMALEQARPPSGPAPSEDSKARAAQPGLSDLESGLHRFQNEDSGEQYIIRVP